MARAGVLAKDDATLARSAPAGFAWVSSERRWRPADHLLLLSRKLVDVAAGRIPRLMVFMPPRHGKSELISRYTPAWYLGRFPDRKVMLCSYADTFAASWGRRSRDEFKEMAPKLWSVEVNPETAGGAQWEVLGHEGIMVTAGVGGGITGKGADLLIVDDPVKNAQDAASQTIQELQHDWWKSTARTRLMPGAGVVLVMTRWHEADLAGRLIADWQNGEGDEWEIISLPAFSEERSSVSFPSAKLLDLGPDPLDRPAAAALWPAMYDEDNLTQTRLALGGHWFNALYQQRPSAAEGNLFKRKHFRYYERRDTGVLVLHREDGDLHVFDPAYGMVFQTVDAADSERKAADFTVVATWLVTVERDLCLLDRRRVQFEGTDVIRVMREEFWRHKPAVVYVEKASSGTKAIAELVREGLPIVALDPDTDKITRALPMVARYEEHRVFHPLGVGWVEGEWEPELLNFPNAAHDDQVDTAAYAGMQLPLLGATNQVRGVARRARAGGRNLTGGLLGQTL